MKKLFFITLFSFLSCMTIFSQEKYPGFLFDNFEDGKAIYKKNDRVTYNNLNYDTMTEKMLFMLSDGAILELYHPELFSYIEIGNHIFEYISNGMFYEKINIGDHYFYIRWKTRGISEGKDAAYGTKSSTGSIQNVSQIVSSGNIYQLRSTENFRLEADNSYYLKIKNKFKRFGSFKSLAKLFKEHENQINIFVNEKQLDFNDIEDIRKAVAYCFQITS